MLCQQAARRASACPTFGQAIGTGSASSQLHQGVNSSHLPCRSQSQKSSYAHAAVISMRASAVQTVAPGSLCTFVAAGSGNHSFLVTQLFLSSQRCSLASAPLESLPCCAVGLCISNLLLCRQRQWVFHCDGIPQLWGILQPGRPRQESGTHAQGRACSE